MHTWLLPEYLEDLLPPDAWRVEQLRRQLLDLFHTHGYRLIVPPLLEYLPSLLTGTGYDMELQTFTVVDQLSGRMMGLRADITPQAARIDAHLLNRQGVVRLCYAGSVLHTLPNDLTQTREPLQIGAELFGHGGLESDVEIQRLMLNALACAGINDIHLDIGHVGISRHLAALADISAERAADLFQALQGKDRAWIEELTASAPDKIRDALRLLPELYGDAQVLDEAARCLPEHEEIHHALAELRAMAVQLGDDAPRLCFDLAESRGYRYHSGIVFAAYARGRAAAVAQGGRYDEVGKAFGRARPATGFSMDLRILAELTQRAAGAGGILAPYVQDAVLQDRIDNLRAQGEVVVVELPGSESHRRELGCERILVRQGDHWEVAALNDTH